MEKFDSWRIKGLEELLEESTANFSKEVNENAHADDTSLEIAQELVSGTPPSSEATESKEDLAFKDEAQESRTDNINQKLNVEELPISVSEPLTLRSNEEYKKVLDEAKLPKVLTIKINMKAGDFDEYLFTGDDSSAAKGLLKYIIEGGKIISLNRDDLPRLIPLLQFFKNFNCIISFYVKKGDFDSISLDRLRTIGTVSYE